MSRVQVCGVNKSLWFCVVVALKESCVFGTIGKLERHKCITSLSTPAASPPIVHCTRRDQSPDKQPSAPLLRFVLIVFCVAKHGMEITQQSRSR